MKTLAFFNNKGGVGKTTLAYHLAWMMAEQGRRVLVVDLDPQANLTSMFLSEDRLERLWDPEVESGQSIMGALDPLIRGIGDVRAPHVERIHRSPGARLVFPPRPPQPRPHAPQVARGMV